MISRIQHFEADFLWKVSLKILNSGIILKTFTHVSINISCADPYNEPLYIYNNSQICSQIVCLQNGFLFLLYHYKYTKKSNKYLRQLI